MGTGTDARTTWSDRACALCGRTSAVQKYTLAFGGIVECACGLVRLVESRDLTAFVRKVNETCFEDDFVDMNTRPGSDLIASGRTHLARITRYKASGELLDFGCGSGELMEAATAAGFEAWGIDSSDAARDFVRRHRGFRMYAELNAVGAQMFDVVALKHVLEHVPEPLELVRSLSQRLRPGGILYVAVPNVAGWASRVLKDSWSQYGPWHLYYFSAVTLTALASKAGLRPKDVTANSGKSVGAEVLAAFIKHRLLGLPRTTPEKWRAFCPEARTQEFSGAAHRLAAYAHPILEVLSYPVSRLSFALDAHDELIGIFEKP